MEAIRRSPGKRRHSLVAPGSEPVLLEAERPFLIGRSADCQLSIPSQRVSRRHAEIRWRAGFPVLHNLSEQNPVLVNGAVLADEHELRNKDELQIGPYRCVYRVVFGEEDPRETLEGSKTVVDPASEALLEGSLEVLNLFELLRTYEAHRKTGVLTLHSGTRAGEIQLRDGRFISAKCEQLSDEEALFALLAWTEGSFVLGEEAPSGGRLELRRKHDYGDDAPKRRPRRGQSVSELLGRAAAQRLDFLEE